MESLKTLLSDGENPKSAHVTDDILRSQILTHAKDFKTSWVKLGQALYAVWNDKMFKLWGYEKFETYTQKELGMKKQIAIKILKSYYFLEHEEPSYLKEDYSESTQTALVPSYDTINVLRLAKNKKDLSREEFGKLKEEVFLKGKDAAIVRKELTALMKERKEIDPDEERDKRNLFAVRRFMNAFRSFQKDMETLKLVPVSILQDMERIIRKIEVEAK